MDGRGSSPDTMEMTELYGGARISYIFHDIFAQSLDGVNPFDGLSDEVGIYDMRNLYIEQE